MLTLFRRCLLVYFLCYVGSTISFSPTGQPTGLPTNFPSSQPSRQPTSSPTLRYCPRGTYSSTGRVPCVTAPSGSYTNSVTEGATSIIPCPIGTFSNVTGMYSSSACKNCAQGYYADHTGTSTCTISPSGFYTNAATQATAILPCPPGTSSSALGASSSTTCQPCASGYYSSNSGSSTCMQAPAGYYTQNGIALQACIQGTYSTQLGATSAATCTLCGSGKYSHNVGSSDCLIVPAGFYANALSGASSITACPQGTSAASPGGTDYSVCLPCLSGSFSSLAGSSSCTLSSPGYFSAVNGSTSQTACPAGTFTNNIGASACQACLSGCYSTNIASTFCAISPLGYYTNAPDAATGILICPIGTYQSTEGAFSSTFCHACPRSRTSSPGTTDISNCFDPSTNFAIGILALSIAIPLGFIYIVLGDIDRYSYLRTQKLTQSCASLYSHLYSAIMGKLRDRHKARRKADHHAGGNYIRTFFFLVLGVSVWFISAGITLGFSMFSICFHSLILSKSLIFEGRLLIEKLKVWIEFANVIFPFLRSIFYPLKELLMFLFDFHVDLTIINVTCTGSQAPLELLVNIAIVVLVLLYIGSDYAIWIEVHLQATLQAYIADCTSAGMRTFFFSGWSLKLKAFALFIVLHVHFMVVQYSVSFVKLGPFIQSGWVHDSQLVCDGVNAVPNMDTVLAFVSTVIFYALIVPVVYTIGRVLCPGISTRDDQLATYIQNYKSNPLPLAARTGIGSNTFANALRLATSLDGIFLYMSHHWAKNVPEGSDHPSALHLEDIMAYTESDFDGFGSEDAFGRLYTEIPNYWEMTMMVGGGDIEWTLLRWIMVVLAQIPLVPLLSTLGRKCWMEICLKLGYFLSMCLGVWTDEAFTRFRIAEKVERLHLKEYIKVGYGQYILAALLCPRAILLRCIPFFAPLQIFVLQMSTTPLYVGSEQLSSWLEINPSIALTWNDKWAKLITSIPDYLNSFWAYQYFSNLFAFIVSMILTFSSPQQWNWVSFLSLIVLVPNALSSSLANVVRLGRILGVKDQDIPFLGWFARRCGCSSKEHGGGSKRKIAVTVVEPF